MSFTAAVILNVAVVGLSPVCVTASAGVVRLLAEQDHPEGAAFADGKFIVTVCPEQDEPMISNVPAEIPPLL